MTLRVGDKVAWQNSDGDGKPHGNGVVEVLWVGPDLGMDGGVVLIEVPDRPHWSRFVLVPARVLTPNPVQCPDYTSTRFPSPSVICEKLKGHPLPHEGTIRLFTEKGSQDVKVRWT